MAGRASAAICQADDRGMSLVCLGRRKLPADARVVIVGGVDTIVYGSNSASGEYRVLGQAATSHARPVPEGTEQGEFQGVAGITAGIPKKEVKDRTFAQGSRGASTNQPREACFQAPSVASNGRLISPESKVVYSF